MNDFYANEGGIIDFSGTYGEENTGSHMETVDYELKYDAVQKKLISFTIMSSTKAPDLPAEVLEKYSYQYMFQNCSNLNYVKCLATDISASSSHSNWLNGVAANGTFVKKAGVTWPSGVSGIPNGWTVTEV